MESEIQAKVRHAIQKYENLIYERLDKDQIPNYTKSYIAEKFETMKKVIDEILKTN